MAVAMLIAVLGSLAGLMIVSPLVAIAGRHGTRDETPEDALRQSRIAMAVGQLVGIAGAVGWWTCPLVGAIAGVVAAALVWILAPASQAFRNGLLLVVPAAVGGAVAAGLAWRLLGCGYV